MAIDNLVVEYTDGAGVSSSSAPYIPVDVNLSADCISLATNSNVNWRDTALQTDQEIVECLSQSPGNAVGTAPRAVRRPCRQQRASNDRGSSRRDVLHYL